MRSLFMSIFLSAIAISSVVSFIFYLNKCIDAKDQVTLNMRNKKRAEAKKTEEEFKFNLKQREEAQAVKDQEIRDRQTEEAAASSRIMSINEISEHILKNNKLNELTAWDPERKYTTLHHFVMKKYRKREEFEKGLKRRHEKEGFEEVGDKDLHVGNFYQKVIELTKLADIVNVRANDNDTRGTPLHFLAHPTRSFESLRETELSNAIIFRDLYVNGANINALDAYGQTVYDLAIDYNLNSLVNVIESGFEKINGKWQRKALKKQKVKDGNGEEIEIDITTVSFKYHYESSKKNDDKFKPDEEMLSETTATLDFGPLK